jgi:hypothetical protein
MTPAASVTVGRSALVRAAGLNVGILVMNPDPADPAARITIGPTAGTREDNVIADVRAGDRLTVAGRIVTVTAVIPGSRPAGRVDLTIEEAGSPGSGGDPRTDDRGETR